MFITIERSLWCLQMYITSFLVLYPLHYFILRDKRARGARRQMVYYWVVKKKKSTQMYIKGIKNKSCRRIYIYVLRVVLFSIFKEKISSEYFTISVYIHGILTRYYYC